MSRRPLLVSRYHPLTQRLVGKSRVSSIVGISLILHHIPRVNSPPASPKGNNQRLPSLHKAKRRSPAVAIWIIYALPSTYPPTAHLLYWRPGKNLPEICEGVLPAAQGQIPHDRPSGQPADHPPTTPALRRVSNPRPINCQAPLTSRQSLAGANDRPIPPMMRQTGQFPLHRPAPLTPSLLVQAANPRHDRQRR
jgi:hypothetical protein